VLPAAAADLDAEQAAVASTLIESIGELAPDETPRIAVDSRSVVTHFAAPRGRSMSVDGALPDYGKEQRALTFVESHAQALGIASDRVELNVYAITTTPDRSYVRIKQQYDGIPVHRAEIVMQIQPDGTVKSFLADIMTETAALDADPAATEPGMDAAQAAEYVLAVAAGLLENAQEDYQANIAFAVEAGEVDSATARELLDRASVAVAELSDEGQLLMYAPYVIGAQGENALAWAFKVWDSQGVMSPIQVFVDADTGELLHLNPLAADARNRRLYDNRLRGDDGIPYATLRRTETSGPVTIFQTIHFADFNAHWDVLGYTYNYFNQNHGWDAMDGVGGTIYSYMRWDAIPEAQYINGIIKFGTFGMAVSDDVVGHEYTHGVLDSVVGLIPWGQAGAIGESLSDMWGEFVDWSCPILAHDLAVHKWKIGELTGIGVIRDMKNPPAKNHPDRFEGPYWYSGQDNYIFVHTNCGVGNKLVYLLTEGDTFNGETIAGMGEATVRNLYWETIHLMPTGPGYHDLYLVLLDAADNLGFSQAQINNVQNACEAVEID